MCAVPDNAVTDAVQTIEHALNAKLDGSPALFNALIIRLSKNNHESISQLLQALSGYAVTLSDGNDKRSASLRLLVDAALRFDFVSHADNEDALSAMHFFILNLISASSKYVEPVILIITTIISKTGQAAEGQLHSRLHSFLRKLLDVYPRCSGLLVRIVKSNFPHHVRPVEELQAYTRFLLGMAEYFENTLHRARLIDLIVEKMAIVDAYVPVEPVVGESIDSETSADMTEHGQEKVVEVNPTMQKMDVLLLEVCEFINRVSKDTTQNLFPEVFEAFVRAHKTRVVPMHRARFVPFSVYYAACCAGEGPVRWLVESLRQYFFDERLSKASRVSFVQHSAALVCRIRYFDSADALAWLNSLVSWLHSYLDFVETARAARRPTADADQHRLFYGAVAAVMYVTCYRRDALASSSDHPGNVIGRMRILRLLRSRLNPLKILPADLTQKFASVICEDGAFNLNEVFRKSSRQSIATKTCFNNLNYIHPFFPLEPPALPSFGTHLMQFYRQNPETTVLKMSDQKGEPSEAYVEEGLRNMVVV
eukprot:Plantae.Rhodophyta-Hildenbrandia_rubra.ctg16076.p1 GENE.Plantae.Rhodophyta-Hildenbrandia_rubra.ctg16076~~Plantae.Rhodophyta-Hildenbrandia_rubra.ctg16076.p1  ORF type:complete len:538 (-),score=61.77 Plantae.Rhodophyta-Hildenbrandia_rubra.ctg16076:118-1731(-)